MSVTIKQIAQRAGLSVPTVSRILNHDSTLFRAETREKVLKAARDLGYRPNSYRMALRTKKFNAIGLLCPEMAACPVGRAGLDALVTEMHRSNQHLVIGRSPSTAAGLGTDDAVTPKMLREWSVDGMLVPCPIEPLNELLELIRRNKIPTIFLHCKRSTDAVYADLAGGVRKAVEHLLSLGHKRIAFSNLSARQVTEEYAGYRAAMQAAGLAVQSVTQQHVPAAEHFNFAVKFLRAADHRPTAAICAHADDAMTLHTAAISVGLTVPRDLSLVALSDATVVGTGVPIATVAKPDADVCRRGLEALSQKMADPSSEVAPRIVPTVFHEGATMAAPGA